ncbi:MAG: N-acetyltransferase [Rhodocyclaceae bacterium]
MAASASWAFCSAAAKTVPARHPQQQHKQVMENDITIRAETAADIRPIADITEAAFKTLAVSNHTEHFIIAALRRAGALAVSLVADLEGQVVGHIAFSPVAISDGSLDWYGLGPVSVVPAHQRQGIGRKLILEGLSRLKKMDAKGCCLVGHPDYYRKFGFANVPSLGLDGVPPEVFFALSFDGKMPRGSVTFQDAFKADR